MSDVARMRRPASVLVAVGAVAVALAVAAVVPTQARFVDAANAQTGLAAQPTRALAFTEVSAGVDFSLALSEEGMVYAWGLNSSGQLGLGADRTNRDVPVRVALPESVRFTAISAGRQVAMALSESGVVYAWGDTSGGTPTAMSTIPAPVAGVSAGGQFFLAWTTDGRLYSWGNNGSGRLGRGEADVFYPVPDLVTAAGVGGGVAGADAGRFAASAWSPSGAVYAWGDLHGGPGGRTMGGVPAGTVREVAHGHDTKMLLMDDGRLLYSRQSNAFAEQTGVSGVVDVSAAIAETYDSQTYLALTDGGGLFAWLDNGVGQYGDGTFTAQTTPRAVASAAVSPEGLRAVSAGDTHSLVLTSSGRILSTGSDGFGQLGNGGLPATAALTALPPVVVWA